MYKAIAVLNKASDWRIVFADASGSSESWNLNARNPHRRCFASRLDETTRAEGGSGKTLDRMGPW